jgi:hypothetical protein
LERHAEGKSGMRKHGNDLENFDARKFQPWELTEKVATSSAAWLAFAVAFPPRMSPSHCSSLALAITLFLRSLSKFLDYDYATLLTSFSSVVIRAVIPPNLSARALARLRSHLPLKTTGRQPADSTQVALQVPEGASTLSPVAFVLSSSFF